MINSNGTIQNNRTASDFIRQQKKLNKKFKILTKEEEREMIERYAKLKLTDGKPTWNKDFECDFEWTGNEEELREKLIMHNLQAVTSISRKHCQDTRDYDNMYAKGLYGLTIAGNTFHPFKLATKKNSNGVREVQYDSDGNPIFIKFNTHAQFWIFKYVMDEFYQKSIKIDNNSTSINELVRMHSTTNTTVTFENYLSDMLAPELPPQKTVTDEIVYKEASNIMDSLQDYLATSSDISSLERGIIEEAYFNGNSSVKKLAQMFGVSQKVISENQITALSKLREYLVEEHGITDISDVI